MLARSAQKYSGKDDLCNTNMSRQNKNLNTTHAHFRKNAGTELTKSKLLIRTTRQVLDTSTKNRKTKSTSDYPNKQNSPHWNG